jgi:hypothetical protein
MEYIFGNVPLMEIYNGGTTAVLLKIGYVEKYKYAEYS